MNPRRARDTVKKHCSRAGCWGGRRGGRTASQPLFQANIQDTQPTIISNYWPQWHVQSMLSHGQECARILRRKWGPLRREKVWIEKASLVTDTTRTSPPWLKMTAVSYRIPEQKGRVFIQLWQLNPFLWTLPVAKLLMIWNVFIIFSVFWNSNVIS